jgi:Putative auto-transporter adhesin, head GIN domain
MTRPVTLVALVGILTAAICLPLAAVLHHGSDDWPSSFDWFDDDDDAPQSKSNEVISRDYEWAGDMLELDVAADVVFVPGPQWHLSIRGPQRALDRLTVENGVIRARHRHRSSGDLKIEVSGPALKGVTINGSGNVALNNVQQDSLGIDIHGSGSVRASGKVDSIKINIMGSGSAAVEKLAVQTATIFIAGSGDVDVAPTDGVDIFIAGAGDVRLHTHPKHINSKIAGSGRVIEVSSDQVDSHEQRFRALA